LDWVNAYAPEHLILQIAQPQAFAEKVANAGSVFLGPFTPESAGDYASGTNHTLPTGGHARAYAGVSLDSFVKKITFQEISASGLALLGPHVEEMARAEGLSAHARAVSIRNTTMAVAAPAVPASEWLLERLRPNIRALKPYSSARDEFKAGSKGLAAELIFMDANENSLGCPLPEDLSRYPGPQQGQLKTRLAEREHLSPEQIFLGNGSDEAIDLLLRAFCEPGLDNVVLLPPTYGMYAVMANIQGVDIRQAPLRPDFSPDPSAVRATWDARSKILFLCSPNNPSGNLLPEAFVLDMLREFPGLVVVDEAYGDFSGQASVTRHLPAFPNLVVLKTLSKAWGLAGLRLGMAFAQPALIEVLQRIKYPYNLGSHTHRLALAALDEGAAVQKNIETILAERERLARRLRQHPAVVELYPSVANFLLVKTRDADRLYAQLLENQIVVRNRSQEMYCENCLRITVGSPSENDRLLAILDSIPVELSQPQA
ncbi:MAG: histidinol-phosphate transaminase, partial [Saprospiraceae bacterium]|nr:histidinol-phosphate transaminase [Saprospiraceae bacterium]